MLDRATQKMNVYLFAVKATFIWLVFGTIVRRRYQRCIERDEVFYIDEELGDKST